MNFGCEDCAGLGIAAQNVGVCGKPRAYPKLKDHEVRIHTEAYTDPARVVEQVAGADALLLTQQRVPITRQIVEKLPQLKFISQTGRNVSHVDVAACTERGIVISAGGGSGAGTPYSV